jgi:hypothetical protein
MPAFSPLTQEALENAETADLDGMPFRVVPPEYLAVIALSVGRAKDYTRMLALLESASTNPRRIETLAARHGLNSSWKKFESRFLNEWNRRHARKTGHLAKEPQGPGMVRKDIAG